ncbi:MAG: SusC/RagA family TonB-linked outer membrane protein [Gemmatimonadaceae bacterium]|nr:SusC/RagA family TonB-linked outer membrane protein [Gemmatimonadaceae bacterium]
MELLRGLLREKNMLRTNSFRYGRPQGFRAMGMSLLFTLALSGSALGQQIAVSGTVTATSGAPLAGVTVVLLGTETRTVTSASGRYFLNAPADGVLTFAQIGHRLVQTTIAGRTTVDVTMARIPYLDEVLVTAYTEQRRSDITGAVASVDLESTARQTGASILQRLDAAVPGVTVNSSGSPGSRSTVRVRGVSSFQNNDPLYIVDGTPVQDSYINFLNPDDITSLQVLKDASASSIYGSRASNGVIVIETTKKGAAGPPQVTLRLRTGVATPVRGYDDFLITDALEYHEVVRQSYLNAGLPVPTNIYGDPDNPTVPNYIFPNNCTAESPCSGATTTDEFGRLVTVDESAYSFPNGLIMPGSEGTNWWDAVFGRGQVSDFNMDVAGGGADTRYGVSFNYFNQAGTAKYNRFERGSVRVNTAFTRKRLTFGENIVLAVDRHHGGVPDDGFGEGGILGKNILSQPVVPLRDIQGNFASGKAVGLGNNSNPLKFAFESRDNQNKNNRVFGNVFAGLAATPQIALRTTFGFNLGQGSFAGFTPIFPEDAEPNFTNSIREFTNQFTDWTWTNTLRYVKAYSQHNFDVLLGQEANASTNRYIEASIASLLNSDLDSRYLQDALGDASSKNVFSTGSRSALLSFFGKADYNFADRYVASFTLRQDGSSRLGVDNRWGTFPAFGLGWRLSNEKFLTDSKVFSDVMLRFGWGVTGNQSIPAGRIVNQFGGAVGDTYYDVGGTNSTVVAGFRQASLGNPNLKWEENRSTNVGADLALFDSKLNVVIDLYRRNTNNLLFDPRTPGTAGVAAPPIVNIGKMKNTGVDFSIGTRGAAWNVTLNASHYKNEIVSIDGVQDFFYGPISTRFGNQVINKVGHPIGAFHGLIADGFFRDDADVASHSTQDGAAPGRIKFRDIDGDGEITLADRTIIGSPHPDFTAGLDMGVRRGRWDLSATVFGTFGNDIFDVQKEFYVFRNFSTNVRSDLLANSWTPENLDAKYPRLDVNDNASHAISSFYVEDGSYVRMRNVRLGYDVPLRMRWLSAATVYLQAENLFTITGYDGLDPALPAANVFGPAGDIRDQYRGVDRGVYPSSRMFSIGIITSF